MCASRVRRVRPNRTCSPQSVSSQASNGDPFPRVGRDDGPIVDIHQLVGIAVGEGVANSVIVERLDLFDVVGQVGPQPSMGIGCLRLPAEEQVTGGHRDTITPDGIGPQLEGQAQAIL